jgi:hypothetical protein
MDRLKPLISALRNPIERGWLLVVGFTAFYLLNFLPVSHQSTSNVFYFLCALPSLIWCARHKDQLWSWMRYIWPLGLFLLSILMAMVLKGEIAEAKPCLYVLLLSAVAYTLAHLDERRLSQLGMAVAMIALSIVVWSSYIWLESFILSGKVQRILLWEEKNPLHTAMLIVFALVWLWEFKADSYFQGRSKQLYAMALLGFLILIIWTTLVFQGRSALLGIGVYLALKLWISNYRWYMICGVILAALLTWVTDLYVAFLVRGLSYRPEIWMDAWTRLSQECGVLLGCGKDNYLFVGRWTHAHSAYLMQFYEYGLVVILPFALFALKFFRDGMRYHSRWMLVAAVGWGSVLTTTAGLVTSYKAYWIYFWIPTLMSMVECWRYRTKNVASSTRDSFPSTRFQKLSDSEFTELTKDGHILEQDPRGPKVFQLQDGKMLKLFLVKRLWSSASFWPYSARFIRNAIGLTRLSVPTVKVEAAYRLSNWRHTAVLYTPLPGTTLRQLAGKGQLTGEHVARLGSFVADLHNMGVYFRSLHFGNIVLTPSGNFGLIDIADLKFREGPLPAGLRYRNLRHLCRLQEDRVRLGQIGWQHFCQAYFARYGGRQFRSNNVMNKILALINK